MDMISLLRNGNPIFFSRAFQQSKLCLRYKSSALIVSVLQRKSVLCDKSKHKVIYEFPYVVLPVAILRTRISYTACAVIAAPIILYLGISKFVLFITISSALMHYCVVTFFNPLVKNMVGKIYVSKESTDQSIIVSSIDENGKRVDRIHNIEDILYCDYYSNYSKYFGFVRLNLENSNISYIVNVKHCKVHDVAMCNYIFGSIWFANKNGTQN